jgi:holliday junction DNA helicase RuvA
MYAYLQGKFTYKTPALVHLDAGGVGFEVNISLNTYAFIEPLQEGKLFTYLQVKEDAHTIYGFFEKAEKDMFIMLISVSGVGASTARMMLSALRATEVAAAINTGNVKLLESVKGIGKKTAERLVLELKDKTDKSITGSYMGGKVVHTLENDALNALTALGISRQQAEQSVLKIIKAEPGITGLEDLIKKALKAI